MDEKLQPVPTTYSPAEVVRLVNGQANALLAQLGTLGALDVVGVLGPVRESRYSIHYGIELRESGGGSEIVLLDIPKTLSPETFVGREIKVRGFLQSKKGLQVALQVTRLRSVAIVSPEVLVEEKTLRDILQKPNAGEATFPSVSNLSVSCITGLNSQVIADFRNQVATLDDLDLEVLATNFLEPSSLVEAIERASGTVVILLRGGGNDGDFEVFNRPMVLEAWRCKDAFKITALGHTQNSTLLDRLSHKVADTPTAAGKFLLDQVDSQLTHAYWRDRAEKAATLQNQTQAEGVKVAENLHSQVSVLLVTQKNLEVERATLQGDLLRARESFAALQAARPVATALPTWIRFAIPAAALLGALLGWALAHL